MDAYPQLHHGDLTSRHSLSSLSSEGAQGTSHPISYPFKGLTPLPIPHTQLPLPLQNSPTVKSWQEPQEILNKYLNNASTLNSSHSYSHIPATVQANPTLLSSVASLNLSSFFHRADIAQKVKIFTQKYTQIRQNNPNFSEIDFLYSSLLIEAEKLIRSYHAEILLFPQEIQRVIEFQHCRILLCLEQYEEAFQYCDHLKKNYQILFSEPFDEKKLWQEKKGAFDYFEKLVIYEDSLNRFIEQAKISMQSVDLSFLPGHLNFLHFTPWNAERFYEVFPPEFLICLSNAERQP